jgi:hypothetical protein
LFETFLPVKIDRPTGFGARNIRSTERSAEGSRAENNPSSSSPLSSRAPRCSCRSDTADSCMAGTARVPLLV